MGNPIFARGKNDLSEKQGKVDDKFLREYFGLFADFYGEYSGVNSLYYGRRNARETRRLEVDVRRGCVTLVGQLARLGITGNYGVLTVLRNIGEYVGQVHPVDLFDYLPANKCLRLKSDFLDTTFVPSGSRAFVMREKRGIQRDSKDYLYVLLPGLIIYLRCAVGDSAWQLAEKIVRKQFGDLKIDLDITATEMKEWWDNNVHRMSLNKFKKMGGVLSRAMWHFLLKYPNSYLVPEWLKEHSSGKSAPRRRKKMKSWATLSASEQGMRYLEVMREEFGPIERYAHTADLAGLKLKLDRMPPIGCRTVEKC